MRFFRIFTITRIIFSLIFLGALIVMLAVTLLFWDESGGMRNLRFLALAIPLLVFWIAFLHSKERGIVLYRKQV